MPKLRVSGIQLLVCLFPLWAAPAVAGDYRLGPQDQLQVKVFDLRAGTGEAYQWNAFNGTFTVSADGRVSLPLVGELNASGKTTSDLAQAIATGLQARVGLTAKPDASVQVLKYRPLYVLGSVDKPGEYEYRPDLTVLQAVSLAGGLDRVTGDAMLGYVRDALTTRGDLRVLVDDRTALLLRQARLDAEISGATAITLSDGLRAQANNPDVARLLREEQMLFEARRYAIQSQSAALEQSKVILQQEISALAQKDASLGQQLDTTRKELQNITGLVSRGLTVLPRQLELEQTTAQFESSRLDVSVASLRAKQDISKADRDILELKNTRRSEALQEATEVHNRLAATEEKIDTAQRLIAHVEVRAPGVLSAEFAAQRSPDYLIVRRVDGALRTIAAGENDLVMPGDVIRVVPRATQSGASAVSMPSGAKRELDARQIPSEAQGARAGPR